jgi:ArsR family transcriptional regulator
VPIPLYQAKAEFFRTLGHPARIRVLELLSDGPAPVHELRARIEIEASNLSQQLSVLRRSGLVTQHREGSEVIYALAVPEVRDLLAAARHILRAQTVGRESLVDELSREPGAAR